jgi:hypothetical protein
MNIAHILGDWGRNIGNAFFQLGGLHVLNKIAPDSQFTLIGEKPGYPSYWNPTGGNPNDYFDIASKVDADILILMGPIFRPEIEKIWSDTLEQIMSSGAELILLGVAAMEYGEDMIKLYRRFLKRFPPLILTSRDTDTYQALGDLAKYAYDGIDLAFFLPDFYQPVGLRPALYPFIAMNFDKYPNPKIIISDSQPGLVLEDSPFDADFEFNGKYWQVMFDKLRTRLAALSRYFMFLEGIVFGGRKTMNVGDYNIVRTDHRPHPMLKRKTYRDSNVFVNDVPYGYLEIYSQAELTLTNRLHACVAALSYGKPAMLFSNSPRIRLLERLGLFDITKQPVYLDRKKLEHEKEGLMKFLQESISKLKY